MTNNNANAMNIVKESAKATGRAALLESLNSQLADANALQDKLREERAEELKNNTIIMSVVASRGYVGVIAGDIAETVVELPEVTKAVDKNGVKFSAPCTTLAGVGMALKRASKYGKENLVLYINDYEVARIRGILNRLSAGSKELLTKEEVAYLTREDNKAKYGEPYLAMVKKVAKSLAEAIKEFKSVRVMGHDSIFGWALKNANAPLDLAGTKVKFSKGLATASFKGRNYAFRLASGFRLNGEHELVKNNSGHIVVGREIKEGSEQETARDLLSITNKTIILKDTEERASVGTEEMDFDIAA